MVAFRSHRAVFVKVRRWNVCRCYSSITLMTGSMVLLGWQHSCNCLSQAWCSASCRTLISDAKAVKAR